MDGCDGRLTLANVYLPLGRCHHYPPPQQLPQHIMILPSTFSHSVYSVTRVSSFWISALHDSTLSPSLTLAWDKATMQSAFWLQRRNVL